jgi:hypothetical protein
MNIKMLRISVPGDPGTVRQIMQCSEVHLANQDYPVLSTIPTTSFSCAGKAEGGLYADVETGCQVFSSYNLSQQCSGPS